MVFSVSSVKVLTKRISSSIPPISTKRIKYFYQNYNAILYIHLQTKQYYKLRLKFNK